MQVVPGLVKGVELLPWITPRIARTVIGTNSSKSGNLRLYKFPIEGKSRTTVLHDYCRTAVTGAMEVESAPTDVDQLSNWFRITGRSEERRVGKEGRSV